jgi:hypothetical protein
MSPGRDPRATLTARGGSANGGAPLSRTTASAGDGKPKPLNPDPLLTETEAAKYLGYQHRTLAGWRYRGGGPVFIATSKTSVRYRLSDLEAWIAARRRRSTSDPGPQS